MAETAIATHIGSHDPVLVVLAILIAIAASYTALDIASRIGAAASKAGSAAWLAAAAIAMGGGIWAMHFVAMLAHAVPGMAVAYDPGLTALSLMIAVIVTGGGFAVVSRPSAGPVALVLSGLFMGAGILAMHYVGMAAMRMHATISYDPLWVALSVLIAMGAAIAALWLAFRGGGFSEKLASALAMGLAISGMHFAGMQAASFGLHQGMDHGEIDGSVDQGKLALSVAVITFLILISAIVAAMFDRRFAALASQESLALKRSEEQFRSLYRRTPLPLHALDGDGRIEDVSDAWLRLLGYGRDAVIGRPLINFMTEESARQRLKDWQRLLKEGALHEREYRLVSRDGDFIDVLSTSEVERDAEGRFLRAVGGLVDVTARRQAEEALRQAQKMEAVGQLTGGVAHDFNNILAVILGNLEMLKKRLGKTDPLPDGERLLRMVDNATEGARRGAALTQRMLSFARRQSLDPQSLDIRKLVEGMHDLLERSLPPRLSLRFDFAADLPAVEADAHQLEMALLNLVVNARDAIDSDGGDEDGTIAISADAGTPPPAELENGRFIRISVADTGEGMDEATLARAREPFFTTKGIGRGTGLGLSMVNGFARQSGGTLEIASRKGVGTTVSLWLPIATSAPTAAPDARAPALDHDALKDRLILVVDDEPLLLMSMEAILTDAGAKVLAAETAFEALELARRHPGIACLVTDYAMPGLTGIQLAAAIRVKAPKMPVVITTGYADVPEEITDATMIQKPFGGAALVGLVAAAVARPGAEIIPFDRSNGG